ncbi:MAG: ABC transporter permease [Bacillota bacterium]
MGLRKIDESKFRRVTVDTGLNERIESESLNFWQEASVRLRKNPFAITGMIIIVLLIIFSLVGPYFNEYTYKQQIESPVTSWPLKEMRPRVPGLENIGILDGTVTEKISKELYNPDTKQLGEYKEDVYKIVDENANLTFGETKVPAYEVEIDQYKHNGIEDKYFWFGTDTLGRDQWTRTWKGTRVSLLMGFASAAVCMLIGIAYGSIAGYFGGRLDNVMMRFAEVVGGVPYLVIVTLLMLIFDPGIYSILLALVLRSWIGMARIVRSQILKLKNQEFILAAKTLGTSDLKIIFKHCYPNIIGQVMIMLTFIIPGAIFSEAFLAFIGFGLPAPMASLGVLITDGRKVFLTKPYLMIIPSIVISILMLSLNIFANGLRDALDPKMRNN